MPAAIIRTFLVDGIPEGLRTMELSNRTVMATLFPRPSLDAFLKAPEAERPGLYILVGAEAETERESVYVGEGDPLGRRLRDHEQRKDFWREAIAFTSKDDYLTKTQIQYLEARLIAAVRTASRAALENKVNPTLPSISRADQAETDDFMSMVTLLLAAAGYRFLQSRAVRPEELSDPSAMSAGQFVYRTKGAEARMIRRRNDYVILQGSTALVEQPEYGTRQEWVVRIRRELVEAGILVLAEDGKLFRFSSNATFDTPSTAAAVVAGGGVNGRICWKSESDGRSLKDVEDSSSTAALPSEVRALANPL